MGSWGHGLFASDAALDHVGGVASELLDEVVDAAPGAIEPARLAAIVGVTLQLQSSMFMYPELDERCLAFVAALERHCPLFGALPVDARKLLDQILMGNGGEIAKGRHHCEKVRTILGSSAGPRCAELFVPEQTLTQELADELADGLDKCLRRKFLVEELRNYAGFFGMLLVLEPWHLPVERADRWERAVNNSWTAYKKNPDAPFKPYKDLVLNVRAAIELLRQRMTPRQRL